MIADIISALRIVFGLCMLCFKPFSALFYVFYSLGGITDMLDGFVARKLKIESDFGEKLDSVADIVFFICCAVKILPHIKLNLFIVIWVIIIAALKLIGNLIFFFKYKSLLSNHNILNKITGLMLFAFSYIINIVNVNAFAFTVCVVATFAAISDFFKNLSKGE